MKSLLIACLFFILSQPGGKDSLTGRWQTKPSVKGNVTSLFFRPDNTYEGYINKKPFVSSTYTLEDSTISFIDNGCDGKKGVYKIIFFSQSDSMRWVPVSDSCEERREGIQKLVFGRVKQGAK